MDDDSELLRRWADGDEQSGRALYRRHCDRIAGFFARKLPGASDDAADLVQRTFLKCLETQRAGTEVRNPVGLLFTVARHELFDHIRRARRDDFDPARTSLADLGPSPTQRIARDDETRLLYAAMEGLPLDDQLALELYYWEGLPMGEVARALEITRSAAINRIHRARKALRAAIEAGPATPATRRVSLATVDGLPDPADGTTDAAEGAAEKSLRSPGDSSVMEG